MGVEDVMWCCDTRILSIVMNSVLPCSRASGAKWSPDGRRDQPQKRQQPGFSDLPPADGSDASKAQPKIAKLENGLDEPNFRYTGRTQREHVAQSLAQIALQRQRKEQLRCPRLLSGRFSLAPK
jgi:hypothetical protein